MTEYQVIVIIITLVGFIFGIGKPVYSLARTISKLDTLIEHIINKLQHAELKATDEHRAFDKRINKTDKEVATLTVKVDNHEQRISKMENEV